MTAIQTIEAPRTTALMRPTVTPAAMIEAHKEISALISQALESGKDYGTIPGAGDKPTLLKPGAERLAAAFGTMPRYSVVEQDIDHDRSVPWSKRKKVWRNQFKGDKSYDWTEETGASFGLYRYVIRCELVRRDEGVIVGDGLGSCSTMESKYVDRPRDCENTVLKMAQKRALVAAVLNAFGLSDRFTQDVEDLPHAEPAPTPPPAPEPPMTADQAATLDDLHNADGWTDAQRQWLSGKIKAVTTAAAAAELIAVCQSRLAKKAGDAQEPEVAA